MAKKAYVRNSDNTAWVELASATTDLTDYATKTYADNAASTAVTNLIDAAPSSLNTLNELAAALGDDANYASTITTALANKAPLIPATQTGFRNAIINGDFRIDQRNAGALKNNNSVNTNASTTFGADRWLVHEANTNTVFSQRKSDGTGSDKYYLYITRPSSLNSLTIAQKIESINSYHLAGKTVTLSFRASLSTGTSLTWKASYANTTDSFGTLATPTTTQIATGTVTVGSTFTYNSVTFTVPSEATTGIEISFTSPNAFGVALNLSQVQLELGSVATPFEQRPIGTELDLCYRYFQVVGSGMVGRWSTQRVAEVFAQFKTTMRTNPAPSVFSTGQFFNVGISGTAQVAFTINSSVLWPNGGQVITNLTSVDVGGSVPNTAAITTDCIAMSAEL